MKIVAIAGKNQKIDNYVNAVVASGAKPVNLVDEYDVNEFDGLIIPGGVDINPKRYNQDNHRCEQINDELDEWQLRVLDDFIKAGKPVLGICRGHQLINVYFGGTMIQDIRSDIAHRSYQGDAIHTINAKEGSFLYELYGGNFVANSSHHQSSDILGEGMEAVAFAEDGIIEAARHISLPIITVQFHPERMGGDKTVKGKEIFDHFMRMMEK